MMGLVPPFEVLLLTVRSWAHHLLRRRRLSGHRGWLRACGSGCVRLCLRCHRSRPAYGSASAGSSSPSARSITTVAPKASLNSSQRPSASLHPANASLSAGSRKKALPACDHDADRRVVGRQRLDVAQMPAQRAAEELPGDVPSRLHGGRDGWRSRSPRGASSPKAPVPCVRRGDLAPPAAEASLPAPAEGASRRTPDRTSRSTGRHEPRRAVRRGPRSQSSSFARRRGDGRFPRRARGRRAPHIRCSR